MEGLESIFWVDGIEDEIAVFIVRGEIGPGFGGCPAVLYGDGGGVDADVFRVDAPRSVPVEFWEAEDEAAIAVEELAKGGINSGELVDGLADLVLAIEVFWWGWNTDDREGLNGWWDGEVAAYDDRGGDVLGSQDEAGGVIADHQGGLDLAEDVLPAVDMVLQQVNIIEAKGGEDVGEGEGFGSATEMQVGWIEFLPGEVDAVELVGFEGEDGCVAVGFEFLG